MLCVSSCCRQGFPLAGLMSGQGLPVYELGVGWPGGRHSRLCITVRSLGAAQPARGMEYLKIMKVPNLLGRVYLDNFVSPCPFTSTLTVRKSLRMPVQSSWIWIPVFHK